MKTKIFLLLIAVFFTVNMFSQEHIVEFNVKNKAEIHNLPKYVYVDYVKGNYVRAYLWGENFEKFKQLGYEFNEIQKSLPKVINMATTVEQMADWDRYPTYDVYVQMMQNFASQYPDICRLDTIATSQQGRLILVLEITDNIGTDENEPEFFYTSTMHGDETTGIVLMLRLIDYLLNNYMSNAQVTNIINNVDLYINPLANPDGTYAGGNNTVAGSQRELANGDDPNRDFPYPLDVNHTTNNPETVGMMNFATDHNFVMSANFHGGAEVYNYPWDCYAGDDAQHSPADAPWYEYIGTNYVQTARQVNSSYMTDVVSDGVTEGYDWYRADGTRQDYMNYFHHCKEVTIELSSTKTLSSDQLPAYWDYNKQALIDYVQESLYGIRGVVMTSTCSPLDATISISGYDRDNTEALTDANSGDYHKLIKAGTYTVTYAASGYTAQNVNVTSADGQATIIDMFLGGDAPTTNLSGTVTGGGNGIAGVVVTVKGQNQTYTLTTDADGNFSQDGITCGTYKISIAKDDILPLYFWETITPSHNNIQIEVPMALSFEGTIVDASTGTPLQNATVNILNGGFDTYTTGADGHYSFAGVIEGHSYNVQVKAPNYGTQTKTITIAAENNVLDFAMLPVEGITFEDNVPDEITFSGNADWTRDNTQSYEGNYSMRSGTITDDESTSMILTSTTEAGDITFYYKVSSESGYDELKFYIDGSEQGTWSGEVDWTEASYTISAGSHTFTWTYAKDGSVSEGDDCAWVDLIELPSQAPATYTVTFEVKNGATSDLLEGASVNLIGYGTKVTGSDGKAVFSDVYETTDTNSIAYTVTADSFYDANGSLQILGDINEVVNMQPKPAAIFVNSQKIAVYPNPATDYLIISQENSAGKYKIYDVNGKNLISGNLSNNKEIINIRSLSKGIYFIKIINNQDVKTTKFIKK